MSFAGAGYSTSYPEAGSSQFTLPFDSTSTFPSPSHPTHSSFRKNIQRACAPCNKLKSRCRDYDQITPCGTCVKTGKTCYPQPALDGRTKEGKKAAAAAEGASGLQILPPASPHPTTPGSWMDYSSNSRASTPISASYTSSALPSASSLPTSAFSAEGEGLISPYDSPASSPLSQIVLPPQPSAGGSVVWYSETARQLDAEVQTLQAEFEEASQRISENHAKAQDVRNLLTQSPAALDQVVFTSCCMRDFEKLHSTMKQCLKLQNQIKRQLSTTLDLLQRPSPPPAVSNTADAVNPALLGVLTLPSISSSEVRRRDRNRGRSVTVSGRPQLRRDFGMDLDSSPGGYQLSLTSGSTIMPSTSAPQLHRPPRGKHHVKGHSSPAAMGMSIPPAVQGSGVIPPPVPLLAPTISYGFTPMLEGGYTVGPQPVQEDTLPVGVGLGQWEQANQGYLNTQPAYALNASTFLPASEMHQLPPSIDVECAPPTLGFTSYEMAPSPPA